MRYAVALSTLVALALAAPVWAADDEMPIVFEEDFQDDGALEKWEPMDPTAWKIATEGDAKVLAMHKDSKYRPKVRSPHNYGLVKDLCVGDFVMDLKMQSMTKNYGHRDLCLFFGHQDPSHFYYVHMALRADAHAHSVFIVNGKARKTLIPDIGKDIGGEVYRTKGLVWGDGWHNVRLVRKVDSGLIEVYFDDMTKPIMRAKDTTFAWGRVGVGSFDDVGNYDDIVIRGIEVEPPKDK
jgi:hypothetical protein